MGFRISLSSLFVVVFAAIPLAASGNARAQDPQYTIETIVLTGDVAPGTGGSTYSRLDAPAINETGDVVFRGYLDGDITDFGFWTRHAGNLALVARIGDESPNSGGRTFSTMIIDPNINELGEVIFWGGDTIGGLDGKRVVWAGSAGALTEVVRHGDPAPGTIGRTFSIVTFPRLNDLGNAAFRGLLNFGEGIWRESNGVLELVALEGDAAPQAGGGTFSLLGFSAFNTAGQVAFRSVLGPDFIEAGLWVGEPNNLELIALTGPAGGLAPGTGQKFRALSAPNLNAAGAVVFEGFLEGSTAGSGVWAGQPGALELVALSGQLAPGSDGKTFVSGFTFPVINAADDVAFRASLDTGGFEIGIWVRSGGSLNFVTRTGIDAPGTIGRTFVFFNPPVLNAAGEVAFDGTLDSVFPEPPPGPGPFATSASISMPSIGEPSDPATSRGIWAGSPGNLGLVVRAGDMLEVRPGVFRKITSLILGLYPSGNEDSRGSTFNDAGQVVFAAVLEDGSEGIFVASRDPLTLSKNPDFSTEDTVFNFGETIYIRAWSDQVDFNAIKESGWQLEGAKGPFTNNLNRTYTSQVVFDDNVKELSVGEVVESKVQIKIEDQFGNKLQLEQPVTLVGPSPTAPTPPSAPTGLTATAVSESRIDLTWQASPESGLVSYKIYRDGVLVATVGGTTTSYSDTTGLTASTAYTYRVSAVNAAGEGEQSAPATATTPAPPVVNDPPVAIGQAVTTAEDTPTPTITLTASDTEGDPLTFAIASGPANGILNGTPPNVIYTPNLNFNGADSFTFTANDGFNDSLPGTVTVTVTPVNDAPVANDDSAVTSVGNAVIIDVLANDVDPDGSPLSVTNLTQPASGTGSVNVAGNAVTYTPPDPGFTGTAIFSYTVSDGVLDSNVATVSVEVSPAQTITLAVTDGWDQKNDKTLSADGKLYVVQNSDNDWWETLSGYFTSFEFGDAVPAGATVTSVKVYFEHWQEDGIDPAAVKWHAATGALDNPSIIGTKTAPDRPGDSQEGVDSWGICDQPGVPCTAGLVNDLKVMFENTDTQGKKALLDNIWLEVTFSP